MAGRGRGRGGRGPAVIPFTDEETGKRVTLDVDAPPPLFLVLASATALHPSMLKALQCGVSSTKCYRGKYIRTAHKCRMDQKSRQTGLFAACSSPSYALGERCRLKDVLLAVQSRDQPPVPEPDEQEKKGLVRGRPEQMQSCRALRPYQGASQHVSLHPLR